MEASLVLVILTFAFAANTSSALINYTTAVFGKILPSKYFTTLYGLSFQGCQAECRDKSRCHSVNYSRHTLACQMNEFASLTEYNLQQRFGFVHLVVKDWTGFEEVHCGRSICTKYQTCDLDTEQCVVRECGDLKTPLNGLKYGNVNHVDAKAMLDCTHESYVPTTQDLPAHTRCQSNSRWSVEQIQCVQLSAICKQYLVTSNDSNGAVRSITASTFYDSRLTPTQGILNGSFTWAARRLDYYQFIQVEFKRTQTITGIATQGYNIYSLQQYVTLYGVAFSQDCIAFVDIVDSTRNAKVFNGNSDINSIVINMLETPVEALCVRIKPKRWNHYIEMRMDILGCDLTQYRIYNNN